MTALTLSLLLLSGELFLRHYHRWTARRALPLELRAETRALTWNCIEHAYRVVCLGDSITYGEGMPAELAYPAVLASLLKQAHPGLPAVVVNSGIRGNTSVLGLARMQRDVLHYAPHLVLVAFGWNDARLGYWPLDPLREREMLGPQSLPQKVDEVLRRSHLWLTTRARIRRVARRLGWQGQAAMVNRQAPPEPRVSRDGFELALERIIGSLRASCDAKIVLMTMTPIAERFLALLEPEWRQAQSDLYDEYNQVVRDVAARHDTFLVDLRGELGLEDAVDLLAADGIHLTAEGENEVAQTVFRAGENGGWWEPQPMQWR